MRIRVIESLLPSKLVTNDDVIEIVKGYARSSLSDGELEELEFQIRRLLAVSDTKVRYHRAPNETALGLGIDVGKAALKKADIDPSEIDLLIYVGVARGFVEPATANLFQHHLGLKKATCFDILDACASWLRALHIANLFITSGTYRNIMILNSECNAREYGTFKVSSVEDLKFRFPALTIGEAATATIVSPSDVPEPFYFTFRNWGSGHTLCKIPLPQYREYCNGDDVTNVNPLEFFSMGEKLFRLGFIKMMDHYHSDSVIKAYRPDVSFSHSASDSATMRIAKLMGEEKSVVATHARFGNTVSASIPLGMSYAMREGKMLPNMKVMVGCVSAGLTTGWSCFRYLD
ncbi:MAG TPA: 3-oxoacyl-[acyl-carrier-protein] synthase III C-terminal domain-containing protein [Pyrinomonadaceae bacterium]|jgi:3-oxoacyl-[acyl-carrier-protein] synthase III|nr:3-oxoacyl-[acyl-carrier-protein] synthase III C-terminal domain-containing protein [Pyrinomonadaceae bacterium]